MGALARIHNYNRKCFSLISSALQVKKCEKGKMQKRSREREGREGKQGKRGQQNQQIKNKNVKIMLCSIKLKTETRVEHEPAKRREGEVRESEGKWGKGLRTGLEKVKCLSR